LGINFEFSALLELFFSLVGGINQGEIFYIFKPAMETIISPWLALPLPPTLPWFGFFSQPPSAL
jgi:hypothetical protein